MTDMMNLPDPPAAFSRGDHVELARTLVRRLGAEVVGDLGSLYAYGDASGTWREIPTTRQSQIVQSFAGAPKGDQARPLSINSSDVSGASRLAYDQCEREGFFASAATGVAFSNGFARVDASGVTLERHAKDHRCRYAMTFDFDPAARSDRWDGFLRGLFREDADAKEKIDCLGEFFGAALLGLAPRYQRAVVAIGAGENGKSALADVVTAAFPNDATCAIPPQDMGQEYRRAMLAGKRLNVVTELPEAEIIASESFKAIVTGDLVHGRRIREAPFAFRPEAGHYFAANRLPGTNDQTEGFWRRFLVIEFNRSFKGDTARDPDIAAKIIRDDLPAVIGWMLEGVPRLMSKGDYTIPPSHGCALESWRMSSDQVATFVAEETTPDQNAATSGAALYGAYGAWALGAGHRNRLARNTFLGRLKGLGWAPRHTKAGNVYQLALTGACQPGG